MTSAFGCLVTLLVLVTFVGEAVREAFDPKKIYLLSINAFSLVALDSNSSCGLQEEGGAVCFWLGI